MKRSKLKKILILVENLSVPFDRRVWMEATTLTQAGYKVSVICPQGESPKCYEVLQGISIYRYPLPSLGGILGHLVEYSIALPLTFLLTLVVLVREGFDVIQSANPPDLFFLVGGFFKLFGKKFVFDHHDLVPEGCESRWRGWKLKFMRRLCLAAERATFITADRVIATNESYKEIAIARGQLKPERVFVVRSGPWLNQFKPVAPDPAKQTGRPYIVAYLGVMGPHDGLDYLLNAISYIIHEQKRTDIQFILIGSGDLQPQMARLSQSLGLSNFVFFTGRVPDAQVITYLSSADLCVAPDPKDPLNDVSTMNKIIEYMALGKPVVAFDLKEARVSAGKAAAYARTNDPKDFGEKILELLAAPEKLEKMGRLGRQRFETVLAWEYQRESLLALYRGLLGNQIVPPSSLDN